MSDMHELIGKTIAKISVDPDGTFIQFNTNMGEIIVYHAVGDCCSSSWFDNITGVDCLLGQTVTSTRQNYLDSYNKNEYEYIQEYSISIFTERGVCDVEYRNSSNGYYGGWCEYALGSRGFTSFKDVTCDWQR
jgi:hypothetical protein